MSRFFTKAQKQAVELVTGASGEGDHIKPYALGGLTQVENCQLISEHMNKKKGCFNFEPRAWQKRFIRGWRFRRDGDPFLLIAIPGSGKTYAALECARKWLAAGTDRRLIVVVNTVNLQKQWSSEAARFGIDLQTKEFGTCFKSGYQGGVVTYQSVAGSPLVYRKHCSVGDTMVIFDEVHHCGDDSAWGDAIKEAFGLAKEKLLMSGTPWKSDGKPIPFVKYDGDGYAVGDYRYDYPNALTDKVVRYLVFDHAKGAIKDEVTGDEQAVSESISEREAAKRLEPLLNSRGEYLKKLLEDAHSKLIECRKSVHDAAGLVVCMDIAHAIRVAQIIRDISGESPSIIVSDESSQNDSVESFRKGKKQWLVSVKKISEGIDIKRLQVLCYATNVTSELFFRQAIGRVSRVRKMGDHEGYVFLPADPRLIAAAKNIEKAQVIALQAEKERVERERGDRERLDDVRHYTTTHGGTEAVVVSGGILSESEYREIERIAGATNVPASKVMEIANMLGRTPDQPPPLEPLEKTREQQEDALRKECNSLVNKIWSETGRPQNKLHPEFNAKVGWVLGQSKMPLSKLIEKRDRLRQAYRQIQ